MEQTFIEKPTQPHTPLPFRLMVKIHIEEIQTDSTVKKNRMHRANKYHYWKISGETKQNENLLKSELERLGLCEIDL